MPRACVVVLACTTLFGCGDVEGQAKDDAGMMVPLKCTDEPVCDGLIVRACVDGRPADMLEQCMGDTICDYGRCMSAACAMAWTNRHSLAGCFFYTAQAPNVASDAEQPMSFLVTNPGAGEATVSLERIGESAKWILAASVIVAPGQSGRVSIAREEVADVGVSRGAGLRLVSTLPVTVAQIVSDDHDEKALSTSGTMLLPANVLDSHHRVLTYPQRTTPDIGALAGGAGGAARLLIVGTRPNTPVRLTAGPYGAVIIGPEQITMASKELTDVVLHDGDVLQVSSAGDTDDLSGFEIWADLPVAVFSGNISTTYGVVGSGINSPDMAHEQIPPIGSWSYKYVAAMLPPQARTCDTLLGTPGASASVWRMVAGGPGTSTVEFFAPPGVQGLPAEKITLSEGGVYELIVSGGDFLVEAKGGPVLLAQGIDCEPTLALAVSAESWLSDLSFAVLPNFDQLVAVARPKGAPVTLDDVPIDDTRFMPAGTDTLGNSYEVARISLATCNPRDLVCPHRLTGQFGMTLRGMDVLSSYALTALSWKGCNDLADTTCVP